MCRALSGLRLHFVSRLCLTFFLRSARRKTHTVAARRQRVSNEAMSWSFGDFADPGMLGEIRVAVLGPVGNIAIYALQRALMLHEALDDDEEDADYHPPATAYDSFDESFWDDDEDWDEDDEDEGEDYHPHWHPLDADIQVWRGSAAGAARPFIATGEIGRASCRERVC